MVLARCEFDATDDAGNLLSGVSVEVRRESGGLPQLFSDRAGSTALGNPFVAADGKVGFHVTGGAYKITLTAGSYTRIRRYVGVGRASETDVTLATPFGAWSSIESYPAGALVLQGGYLFISLVDANLNNTPDSVTPADTASWMYAGLPQQPEHFDLALFGQGLYNDGDLLFRYEFTDTVVFAAGLSGSKFSAGTAATGSVALSLKANGVAFGTVNFAVGVTEATFTAAADQTFAPGDVLTVVAPNPKDASLANVSGVLRGSRDAVASINQSGLAVLNFGSFPGTDIATIAVTGEAGITAGSIAEAWIWPGAGTAEHSADEHKVAGIKITPSDVVAGTGFTINGYATDGRQYGRFNVAWRWL